MRPDLTAPSIEDANLLAAALLYDMAALQGTERSRFGYKRAAKAITRLNVPVADLERRAAEFDKHKAKPVIVHCDSGNRSTRAVGVLKARGFASVFNLAGGFGAWQQAGLPVEK